MVHSISKGGQISPKIDTRPLRDFLAAISAQALTSLEGASPEITMKMSSAIVALTKAICEAETHNLKCAAIAKAADGNAGAAASGSLRSRLKGYAPSKKELQDLEATLRLRLDTLAPRLAAEDAKCQLEKTAKASPQTQSGSRPQDLST
jgi:hypothetical protein